MKAFITDDVDKVQTDITDTIIPPAAEGTYSTLKNKLGKETFLGEWYLIDQNCINQFAKATGDNQWIHTDSERAKVYSPFRSTIAHGFLTLALIPELTETMDPEKTPYPEAKMVMMYGLNKVRYLYPIKSGSRVRARIHLLGLTPIKRSIEVVNKVSIEVENRSRPACIAETVLRLRF
jgi:acyl dehydratase